tara:strand:- start:1072 stop:1848 length:777 start_codon:yes stop_codon:yes gene_type:complete
MESGAITQYIDVAQLVLYIFWIFFFGLVIYLTIESKREGFPLEADGFGKRSEKKATGLLPMPRTKIFRTRFNGDFEAPHTRDDVAPPPAGTPINPFPGAPLEPTGSSPMLDDIGPGSFTQRMDQPDLTAEGDFKIVPMSIEDTFKILATDTDPRGLEVFGLEGKVGGTCVDVWVDRSEHIIRYLEIKTLSGKSVLAPFNLTVIKKDGITINSLMSGQFEDVPGLKNTNTISLFEEEKINGYYGAGTLMAFPRRRESFF